MATATSTYPETHTSRSTLPPGGTVMAATTFCPAEGCVTLHDVVNASFAPMVESWVAPGALATTALPQVSPAGVTQGCSSTTPLQLSSMWFAQTSACRLETSGFR